MIIRKKYFLVILVVVLFGCDSVHAQEPILITQSPDMNEVVFDGKWSFYTEWKRSSLDTLYYPDNTLIYLRTAHEDNFIYVFVDDVSETKFNKHGDFTIICFAKDDKTSVATENDYCFGNTLDGKNPFVLQGGSPVGLSGNFKKIQNPDEFIGISSISDKNDRYAKIPHPSYEFRIPIDLIGRSSAYAFYLEVYHSNSKRIYSWPQETISESPLKIPTPSDWGEIISPDKSLPEFPFPLFSLLSAIILVLYITRKKHYLLI
jgi:hypothetical protein